MFSTCKQVVLMASILLMTLIACNGKGSAEEKASDSTSMATFKEIPPAAAQFMATDTAAAPEPVNENQAPSKQPGTSTSTPNIDWDKKIIKNATLTVEAKSHKSFNDFIHDQVKRSGGYLAEEEQNKSDYKIENIVTIKVPVDQFDNLVKSITSTKDDNVVTQKVTSQDVTGEVVDTRARTEAKRQIRLRYLDLLKQAKNMEEILKVQDEINNIQQEIEAGAGRVNYLTHNAAYSTIQLTFYEILNAAAVINDKPGFGKRVLNALGNGMDWVGEMLVVVITLWPLWLFLGGVWWVYRRWRAKTAK
jgi:hypothetical protein